MKKTIEEIFRENGAHRVGNTSMWVGYKQDELSALREAMDKGKFDRWPEAYCAAWRRLKELGGLRAE